MHQSKNKPAKATGRRYQSPDGLLDVVEVAGILRCSPRTVHRLVQSGKMPQPIKIGGLVRWRREAINEWISRFGEMIELNSSEGGAQ